MQYLVPQLLGPHGERHTWRIKSYKGIGRIPSNLSPSSDAAKRILLDQLPKVLRGYGKTPGIDAVIVVLDSDRRDCRSFLAELKAMVEACGKVPPTRFRLAIEEIEAWYFGDRDALLEAYPKARREILDRYVQDSVCDTWERLADAVHPGGSNAIRKTRWPLPGQIKHEWAERIGRNMDPMRNRSPSFIKFRDALLRLR